MILDFSNKQYDNDDADCHVLNKRLGFSLTSLMQEHKKSSRGIPSIKYNRLIFTPILLFYGINNFIGNKFSPDEPVCNKWHFYKSC